MSLAIDVNDKNRARYGLIETFTTEETSQTKSLKPNGDNGVEWVEDDNPIILSNEVIVTQSNFTTTLGGTVDSTKDYFLDGKIDTGNTSIVIPSTGLSLRGYNFELSGLYSTEDNYTMFVSESIPIGSGNFIGQDYDISVSGTNSKVYELYDATGFNAFEFSRINYSNCTSLGDIYDYRQGLESGTGRFGGSPSLTLHGVWLGGYRISTSIIRGMSDTTTEPIFKAGTLFQMNSRFLTDINCDLGTLQPFCDFSNSNFPNPSTLQIHDTIFTRDGAFVPDDVNIFPNITPSELASDFRSNKGLGNTYVGGNSSVIIEAETTINTVSVWETLNTGAWLNLDLQHFDSPSTGQLRHLGDFPRDFEISAQVVIDGGANDSVSIKFRKWDDSEQAFEELDYTTQTRVINNLQGGRDVAYFNIFTGTTLDRNDYLYLQVRNNSDTSNVTAETSSFFRIQER